MLPPEAIVMSGSLLPPRATSGSVLLSMVTGECCAEVHDLSRSLKPCCLWAVLHLGLYRCWWPVLPPEARMSRSVLPPRAMSKSKLLTRPMLMSMAPPMLPVKFMQMSMVSAVAAKGHAWVHGLSAAGVCVDVYSSCYH